MYFRTLIILVIFFSFFFSYAFAQDSTESIEEFLGNAEQNYHQMSSIYYKEKIFYSNGELFSENSFGTPWVIDENNEIQFLNNRNLTGPDGENYSEVIGTDFFADDENEYGYRSFVALEPSKAFKIQSAKELENHLRSLNVEEWRIQKHLKSFGVSSHQEKERNLITHSLQKRINEEIAGDESLIEIQLADDPEFILPNTRLAKQTNDPLLILEYNMARMNAIEERKSYIADSQRELVAYLEEMGATHIGQYWLRNIVSAKIKTSEIEALTNHFDIRQISLKMNAVEDEYVYSEFIPVKPDFVRRITQGEMFLQNGYDGTYIPTSGVGAERINVGVIERLFFAINHDAFKDDSLGGERVFNYVNCNCFGMQNGNFCDDWAFMPDAGCDTMEECNEFHRDYCYLSLPFNYDQDDHATKVLGVIGADCTDGQCSQVQSDEWAKKTGMAPEAGIATFNSPLDDAFRAIQKAITMDNIDILNYSASKYNPEDEDDPCPVYETATGQDTLSEAANSAFLNGILVVTSAGNNRNDCDSIPVDPNIPAEVDWISSIGSPASAAGALAVGAYHSYFVGVELLEPPVEVTEDPYFYFEDSFVITDYSSRGRTYDFRVKPDILAPSNVACLPKYYDNQHFNDCEAPFNQTALTGTSAASPVAAGSAAILKSWMIHNYGETEGNDPGRLMVNMINFGDRVETESLGFMDSVNGAGRLRMRLPSLSGMDTPASYRTYKEVFHSGDSVTYYINPLASPYLKIPADVEFIKIAVWWYDSEIELGYEPARFTMTLKRESKPTVSYTVDSYQEETGLPTYHDQKMQIILDSDNSYFANFPTDGKYTLTITNIAPINDHNPLVSVLNPARTVYITYFWEDTERDDSSSSPCCDNSECANQCDPDDPGYLFYR